MKTTDQRDVIYVISLDLLLRIVEIAPRLFAQVALPMGPPWWRR